MKIKVITNDGYPNEFPHNLEVEVLNGKHITREKIMHFIKDAEILLLASESVMPFDKELIDNCGRAKFISIDTTDYSWIDVIYAKQKGIIVSNNPGCSTEAVTEHSLAFMLNFSKKIHHAYQDLYLKNGNMRTLQGAELKGRTLGIIGMGNIGSRLAEIANCMGMNVLAWNKTPKNHAMAKMVGLDELLNKSDFVSLNITSGKDTENFLDKDKISQLKKGAFVLNLADKKLVDNDSLLRSLNDGLIGGYGVELWEISEQNEHPLYSHDNVIALNGFGWFTEETIKRTFDGWLSNVDKYLRGKVVNTVN